MSYQLPSILSPPVRFAPLNRRSASRSPSRSPTRQARFAAHELDPLLSNLSPRSTLEALQATEAVTTNESNIQDVLRKSIAQASTTERALGIRAALAAQKLREWHAELLGWEWPKENAVHGRNGFQPPRKTENSFVEEIGMVNGAEGQATAEDDEYFGSLPTMVLQHYEERIDEIRDALETLDVEELKEHVLNAHTKPRSRPSSQQGPMTDAPQPLTYVQLKDFTAVITATILQALPFLARLSLLLTIWDARLAVSRRIPELLEGLESLRLNLDEATHSVQTPGAAGRASFTRAQYDAIRAALEGQVSSVGSQMDALLDTLEGREDTLPQAWIDELDAIENDFSYWAVQAESAVVENELKEVRQAKIQAENEASMQREVQKKVEGQSSTGLPDTFYPNMQHVVDFKIDGSDDSVGHNPSAQSTPTGSNHARSENNYKTLDDTKPEVPEGLSSDIPLMASAEVEEEEKIYNVAVEKKGPLLEDSTVSEHPSLFASMNEMSDIEWPLPPSSSSGAVETEHVLREGPITHNGPRNRDMAPHASKIANQVESGISLLHDVDDPARSFNTNLNNVSDLNPADVRTAMLERPQAISVGASELNDTTTSVGNTVLEHRSQTLAGPHDYPESIASGMDDRLTPTLPVSIAAVGDPEETTLKQDHVGSAISPEATDEGDRQVSTITPRASDGGNAPASPDFSQVTDMLPFYDNAEVSKNPPPTRDLSTLAKHGGSHQVGEYESVEVGQKSTVRSTDSSGGDSLDFFLNFQERPSYLKPLEGPPSSASHASNEVRPAGDASKSAQLILSSNPHTLDLENEAQEPGISKSTDHIESLEDPIPGLSQQHTPSSPNSPIRNIRNLRISSMPTYELKSGLSSPASRHSDYFSDISTPEIKDASTAEAFGTASPVIVSSPSRRHGNEASSPVTPSRNTSQRTVRPTSSDKGVQQTGLHSHHNRAPSLVSESSTSESDEMTEFGLSDHDLASELKRASIASIEHFTPRDVRSVQIRRSGSFSSFGSIPQQHLSSPSRIPVTISNRESERRLEDQSPFPPPSSRGPGPQALNYEHSSPPESPLLTFHSPLNDSNHPFSPPLPRRSSKRISNLNSPTSSSNPASLRPRAVSSSNSSIPLRTTATKQPSATGASSPPKPTPSSKTPSRPSPRSTDDQFEQKISSILHTIPARIRLAPGPSPSTSNSARSASQPHDPDSSSSSTRTTRSSTPTLSITLTPAFARSFRSQHESGDPSIRLYNLHTAGREGAPMKLHVRLVGERGERVMVRTGGGWADLGEWLRDYALHHGSRNLSDSQFQVESLPSTGTGNSMSQKSSTSTPMSTSSLRTSGNGNHGGRSAPGGSRRESIQKTRYPSTRDPSSSVNATSPSAGGITETEVEDWPPPVPSIPASLFSRKPVPGQEPFTPTPPSTLALTPSSHSSLGAQKGSRAASMPLETLGNVLTPNVAASPPSLNTPVASTPSAYSTPNTTPNTNTTPLAPGGPKARVVSLSAEKQAWIEGMMGAARKVSEGNPASLDRDKERGRDGRRSSAGGNGKGEGFGDMGTVGGTRRLWMRSVGKGKAKEKARDTDGS